MLDHIKPQPSQPDSSNPHTVRNDPGKSVHTTPHRPMAPAPGPAPTKK